MIGDYAVLKGIHVVAVLASGALFAVRGALRMGGSPAAMAAPLRYLSYGIDSVLLAAAVALLLRLRWNPLEHPWLVVKLGLLPVYIVAGSLALKRARTRRMRAVWFGVALLVFGWMLGIAFAHDAASWLRIATLS